MKKKEFNNILKTLMTEDKTLLDRKKVQELDSDIKKKMMYFICRNRGPILVDFIESADDQFLSSMGYLYSKIDSKTGFSFRCLCEHVIS